MASEDGLLPHDEQQLRQAVAASFAAAGLRPRSHQVRWQARRRRSRTTAAAACMQRTTTCLLACTQVDAVCTLVQAVRRDCDAPAATNYLLQHAAGSGKSLTIAALAAALLRTVSWLSGWRPSAEGSSALSADVTALHMRLSMQVPKPPVRALCAACMLRTGGRARRPLPHSAACE